MNILSECPFGYYGENCSNGCGNCLNNSTCDHLTGACTKGCEPGYKEPKCTKGN